MSRVALILDYPYESFRGGDGAYIAQLRRFLQDRGHRVETLVSDITRGRSNPVLRFRGGFGPHHRWRVRRALGLGEATFVSTDPALYGRAARRLVPGAAGRHRAPPRSEAAWIEARLKAGRYDAVILVFDACRYAAMAQRHAGHVLALRGFFQKRSFSLGTAVESGTDDIPAETAAELAAARLVGLNCRAEVDAYSRLRDPEHVVLVGMGFSRRPAMPLGERPFVLFVGAMTPPNVASLRWFLTAIWPKVVTAHPGAELRVAGAVHQAFSGESFANVAFLGTVERIDDEYAKAQVVVVPLVEGSAGVKTKVAEALSFSRPLVTTSLGVDLGDPRQFGDAVVVADDPDRFAAAVNRLLADPELRRRCVALSPEAFDRNFSYEAAYGTMAARLGL